MQTIFYLQPNNKSVKPAAGRDDPDCSLNEPPLYPGTNPTLQQHKRCASLEGSCCPTQQGIYLGCCGSVHVSTSTGNSTPTKRSKSPSSAPSPSSSPSSSTNTTTASTSESKSKSKSTSKPESSSKPKVGGEAGSEAAAEDEDGGGGGDARDCANYPGCAALQGACCPASDGTMLSCCSSSSG